MTNANVFGEKNEGTIITWLDSIDGNEFESISTVLKNNGCKDLDKRLSVAREVLGDISTVLKRGKTDFEIEVL
ncbi:hypothetical protein LCGC14_2571870 [marine sediment metagenome]|uniref:Uncharacterized protein n=1 Tax=marine sediment metagenome TaxID=412755 RepID=A0A0F9B4X8_9ZZZZ